MYYVAVKMWCLHANIDWHIMSANQYKKGYVNKLCHSLQLNQSKNANYSIEVADYCSILKMTFK